MSIGTGYRRWMSPARPSRNMPTPLTPCSSNSVHSAPGATTINATLAAIRKITKVCVRMNLIDREDMLAIQDLQILRVRRLLAGCEVRIGEFEAIFRACRDDKHEATGWHDIAVLGHLYICGLRRLEVAAIDIEHYDRETITLKVLGKGNKERLIYPDPGTHAA